MFVCVLYYKGVHVSGACDQVCMHVHGCIIFDVFTVEAGHLQSEGNTKKFSLEMLSFLLSLACMFQALFFYTLTHSPLDVLSFIHFFTSQKYTARLVFFRRCEVNMILMEFFYEDMGGTNMSTYRYFNISNTA